jgi:hypothetical protein
MSSLRVIGRASGCECLLAGRFARFATVAMMARWVVMLVLAAACGADSSGTQRSAPLPLCALCDTDADCETGICRQYGDGYRKCSNTCVPTQSTPPQCSEGCNNMGYCMCPHYEPPPDADTSGVSKDAPTAIDSGS